MGVPGGPTANLPLETPPRQARWAAQSRRTRKNSPVRDHRNNMCPSGSALHHPAAATLVEYSTKGCPTKTGRPWTLQEVEAAIGDCLRLRARIGGVKTVKVECEGGKARLPRNRDML